MMLHDLKPAAGSNRDAKRKGRGAGSGNGKTAGYGHKGQLARSGHKPAYFEGGQMPLVRRLLQILCRLRHSRRTRSAQPRRSNAAPLLLLCLA